MAEINLVGLTKTFGDVVALNDVSFHIRDQEFVTMLGPTGAGKTTTLRCVAGLEKMDQGEVVVNSSNINALPPGQRNMAYVSQHYALYPHMTVYRNLQFPLDKTNLTTQQKKQRIEEMAKILHIEPLLQRYPSKLSGGEMQRVVIGRAMVRSPQLFLLDEPLSNLDAKLREELRFELKRLQKEAGATTLFVTHDQIEAMSMSDKVVVIHQGVIQQIGTPAEIYSYPANTLVSSIVGTPPMNLTAVVVEDGHYRIKSNGHLAVLPQSYQNLLVAGEYLLGVRPENVKIVPENTPNALAAEAYLIEAFGYEKLVEIDVGTVRIRARVSPRIQVKVGEQIAIHFDEHKMRFFNTDGTLIRA
jgi:multiple sugar transport system ATP-binding protein